MKTHEDRREKEKGITVKIEEIRTVHLCQVILDEVLLSVKNERSNRTVPIATMIIKMNCPRDQI